METDHRRIVAHPRCGWLIVEFSWVIYEGPKGDAHSYRNQRDEPGRAYLPYDGQGVSVILADLLDLTLGDNRTGVESAKITPYKIELEVVAAIPYLELFGLIQSMLDSEQAYSDIELLYAADDAELELIRRGKPESDDDEIVLILEDANCPEELVTVDGVEMPLREARQRGLHGWPADKTRRPRNIFEFQYPDGSRWYSEGGPPETRPNGSVHPGGDIFHPSSGTHSKPKVRRRIEYRVGSDGKGAWWYVKPTRLLGLFGEKRYRRVRDKRDTLSAEF